MTTITYGREAIHNSTGQASTGLVSRFRSYVARSRAERQLAQLDDRLLADIGLKRVDITRMVWGE